MANACVLWRREQLIAHSSALTATSQLSRVFLDGAHVVFPMLTWIENGFVRLENPLSGEWFTTWELFLPRKRNRRWYFSLAPFCGRDLGDRFDRRADH